MAGAQGGSVVAVTPARARQSPAGPGLNGTSSRLLTWPRLTNVARIPEQPLGATSFMSALS